MISPSQFKSLRSAINALVKAEVADSWKGGGDPADIPQIEHDLVVAKRKLAKQLHALTESANASITVVTR